MKTYVYQRKNLKTNKVSNRLYATNDKNILGKTFTAGGVKYKVVKIRLMTKNDKGVIYL